VRRGRTEVLRDIDLHVPAGQVIGLLGPSGSGKTTLMRAIIGSQRTASGTIEVFGRPAGHRALRREIGYMAQSAAIYDDLTVEQNLDYFRRVLGAPKADVDRVVAEVGLGSVRRNLAAHLSGGQRSRVSLGIALLGAPKLLVLDEPTVGLDPRQIISIRELIRELGRQHTLLLSTHILPEVELLCDRVVIIDGGRIIAEGTPASLRESWTGNPAVRVDLKGAPEDAATALAAVPGIVAVHPGGIPGSFTLECEPGGDPREAVFRTAVERGWVILELARDRGATLEDIFVRLTTHDTAAGATDTPRQEVVS